MSAAMLRKLVLGALTLAVSVSLFDAGSALAVPQLKVELSHTPTAVPRNDEQVTYIAAVKNIAPKDPSVGDVLTCNGIEPQKNWFPNSPNPEPTFSFEWLRNGVTIPGAGSQTYTTEAADAGAVIQCLVTGTNVNAVATFASLPAVVISPVPLVPPPNPPAPGGQLEAGSRPTIAGTGTNPRTCAAPANWTPLAPDPNAPSYQFQWLINGAPIAGAVTNEYTPVAGDTGKILQCRVVGTNAGGSTVGISNNSAVGTVPQPPNLAVAQTPAVEFANSTSGEVELAIGLPLGEETAAFQVAGTGWTCTASPPTGGARAEVRCSRTNPLSPESSYPPVSVATSVGSDAPDPAVAVAEVSGGGSAPDSTFDELHWLPATPFEITSFTTKVADASAVDYTQAGGHAFSASASFDFSTHIGSDGKPRPVAHLRNTQTDLPAGFIGNPMAVPQRCDSAEGVLNDLFAVPTCPRESIVGGVTLETELGTFVGLPVYVLKPERGIPAQLEFALRANNAMYQLTPRLRPEDGYAITIDAPQAPKSPILYGADVTLCGFGTNVIDNLGEVRFSSCRAAGEAGASPVPLLTNPTRCSAEPPVTRLSIDSWERPGVLSVKDAISPLVTGCDKVPFSPSVDLEPTSRQADSPTGLDVSISVPSEGLETAGGITQGYLKRAVVTLPKGMSVNPAAADGLGACTQAQLGMSNGIPNNDPVNCPDSSKVGSVEITTPILDDALKGNVYLAKQGENPFGSLLALYLVAESKERGILVKLPGRVAPQPDGQLVTSFDNNPQAPIKSVDLHFHAGDRAALLNPPRCGSYDIVSELSPWSAKDPANPTGGETRRVVSSFEVNAGPGGRPCPNGDLDPRLGAGVANPVAGSSSPFLLRLSRDDGTQRFSGLNVTMPPGLTAYLKGVPYCPDSALASVAGAEGTGASQISSPACPAASQIGTVSVGAGGGGNPFYVNSGRAYLAGPYKGAPLSVAIVTPAVAGPFDLGSVVVRAAAHVDRRTAQISVISDPIPTILHGIPLDVRDIRISIDRSDFILAPTSCEAMSVGAEIQGEEGPKVARSARFQVGECGSLAFKPRLSLRLKGGTKRGKNPAFTSTLTYPEGENANIERVSVALPHSAFLDQSHIRTICTRVQFAAESCPAASVYGTAEAVSPLLGYPLTGPVYLRSSSNKLPDLVVALKGPDYQPVEVDLVGRIDSVRGGIRTTFETAPDAPVSKFVLRMQGGKKGLLVNSRDICRSVSRATVKMRGHSGQTHDFRPVLQNSCKKRSAVRKKHRPR